MISRNKKQSKIKPFVAGVIASGICCALYALIFPFYRIGDYLIGCSLSVLAGLLIGTMASGLDTSKSAPSQTPIPETGDAAVDQLIRQGQDMLRAIREENDRIPDPILSYKMEQLDDIANRIFRTVAEQPGKAPQIRRFMDYYLPTTLKMLTGYRKMDERQLQGTTAAATRKQIEDAMDVVLQAFNKQLDTLYQDDMLDISTDIDVLETMMRQDGLLESGMQKSAAQATAQAQQKQS